MMKLAFSTLGCPHWSFDEILDAARRWGYDGIEFRGILREVDLQNVPEFSPAQISETRKRLADAGVRASCLSSSVAIVRATATEVDRQTAVSHAERYVEIAKEVGAPFIRLFCGDVPAEMEASVAMDKAAESLRRIGDFAQARGVTALIETHDAFTRSEVLMDLIRLTNHPAVQVLWDIHHPYRTVGESIAHSMHYLDGHVRGVHVKDSVLHEDGDKFTYVLTGHGDVPIFEALHALKNAGYDGYLTLEWEKRWHPEIAETDEVFPHYIEQMRMWLEEL